MLTRVTFAIRLRRT